MVHLPSPGQGGDRLELLCSLRQRAIQPPTWCNPLGELASLRKTRTIDDYTERFLVHVARAGPLDERQ
jgi:hypothetical protein